MNLVEDAEDPVVEGVALGELDDELLVNVVVEPVELALEVLGDGEVLGGLGEEETKRSE